MTSVYYDTFTTSLELPRLPSGSNSAFASHAGDRGSNLDQEVVKTGIDSSTAKRSATGVSVVDLRPSNQQTRKQTNKKTNKQENKQRNPNKQTKKQTNKQTNKQTKTII